MAKVERVKTPFVPVRLTLETEEEVRTAIVALRNLVFLQATPLRAKIATDILTELDKVTQE